MLTLSAEVLFEIEHEMNEPRFMGVPIGSTLGSIFYLQFFLGHGQWDLRAVWKERMRYWYHFFRSPRHFSSDWIVDNRLEPERILLTMLYERPDMRDLMLPIAEKLGFACNVLALNDRVAEALSPGIRALTTASLGSFFERRAWKKEYQRCSLAWDQRLKRITNKHRIPRDVLPLLKDSMLVGSQHVAAYHALLDILAPTSVVTEYDRSTQAAPLILAARARGIPTMTMIHGVINSPYGYVPMLADVAFCWGEMGRDQMMAMGTPADRLVITGSHRVSRGLLSDRRAARAKFGVTDKRTLVLFASNPIAKVHRTQQIRCFCEAFTHQDQYVAVVRLHPAETLAFYENEMEDFPSARFTDASLVTQDEALVAADIIVVRSSGFGNDALIKDKLVVVLDTTDAPLGNANTLIDKAGCPYVQNKDDLRETTKSIIANPRFQAELHRKAQKFVQYQFAALGNKALINTVRAIREQVRLT